MNRRLLYFLAIGFLLLSVSTDGFAADTTHFGWRILVLIYTTTDFSFTDSSNTFHHVVATMTPAEMSRAANAATHFATTDVPVLTSGRMYPKLIIRYPTRKLTELDSFCGYWPTRANTAPELDPTFDSVIVIWDSSGKDLTTGEYYDLQQCGGLTPPNGTGQTYSTFQIDSTGNGSTRNVFKHEWGHAILFYFDAANTAPKPTVDNHINDTTVLYVHCHSGQSYFLVDETDNNPIPNSIYNDYAGFTHDYYSGTTATPDQPDRCLGISAESWASGGPVTKPIPVLGVPSDGAIVSDSQPVFNWGAVLSNANYELQLNSLYPPTTTVYKGTGLSYKPVMPLLPSIYYWRVRAIGNENTIFPWSDIHSITIVSPQNAAPSRNFYSINRPTLTWNRVTGAIGYEIQVSVNSTFNLPYAFHNSTIPANQLVAQTNPLNDGMYYWRVRAKDKTGKWGGWSAVESFTVAKPIPTLTPTPI